MGIHQNTDPKNISKIRKKRKQTPSASVLVKGILKGDKTALAKAITMVESTSAQHIEVADRVVEHCLNQKTKTIRVGITGVPGVGKSTFIESLGTQLTAAGKMVAVLTIDPSSSESRGSILGDKTRMPELARHQNAFIRPSPSSQSLGGVARKTRETMLLCEAAGYDVILIETVGVGQSETMVHSMVDFFLLLKLAGAGDELQGIKRGIVEMADALVINKTDGNHTELAQTAKRDFQRALHLYPPKNSEWKPRVLTCSALENTGISEIWEMITAYMTLTVNNGFFFKNRKRQYTDWLLQYIDSRLASDFYQNKKVAAKLPKTLQEVSDGKISPFRAAERLLKEYTSKTL